MVDKEAFRVIISRNTFKESFLRENIGKAKMRRVGCGTFQREMPVEKARCWKHFIEEASEDQLRAALIKPGDSVIIKRKRLFSQKMFLKTVKRVEPRFRNIWLAPCDLLSQGGGLFCIWKGERI